MATVYTAAMEIDTRYTPDPALAPPNTWQTKCGLLDQAIIDAGRRYNLPVLTGTRRGLLARLSSMLPIFSVRWRQSITSITQPVGT